MPRMASPKGGTPRSSVERRGWYSCFFGLSRSMMILLGITYGIVVLRPLLKHQSVMLSVASSPHNHLLSLEGWRQSLFHNDTSCPGSTLTFPAVRLEPKNRTIALVHIGKAGGVTLRRMTMVFCKLFFRKTEYHAKQNKIARCIDKFFPDPGAALTHQVRHYFHMEEYNETEMEISTSFLLTLRNPVDRIVSTYRFSHPGNCNDQNRNQVWRPRGCSAEQHRNESGLIQNTIYYQCFPLPAMEDFAQSLMRPWSRENLMLPPTQEERRECRYLARELVQGYGTFGSAPHMLYNFAYYAQRSVWKYPDKEVFGVRTEYEMEDIRALDELLGGNGNLRENIEVSHGSETYLPSPLTPSAYEKLCCLLEQEIEIYEDLLMRVINLDDKAKQEAMESVRTKCGIQTSWTEWRATCRRNLRRDLRLLKPSLVTNETGVVRFGGKPGDRRILKYKPWHL